MLRKQFFHLFALDNCWNNPTLSYSIVVMLKKVSSWGYVTDKNELISSKKFVSNQSLKYIIVNMFLHVHHNTNYPSPYFNCIHSKLCKRCITFVCPILYRRSWHGIIITTLQRRQMESSLRRKPYNNHLCNDI